MKLSTSMYIAAGQKQQTEKGRDAGILAAWAGLADISETRVGKRS